MTLRQIKRNKLLSSINILGLSISLSACLLLLLFIQKELSFDKFWTNAGSIYQLKLTEDRPGKSPRVISRTSRIETAHEIRQYYPEIEEMSFVGARPSNYKIGDRSFKEIFSEAEPSIVNIFDFKVLEGNLDTTMLDPSALALSRKTAKKFFGNKSAIGEIITTTIREEIVSYKVSAIYEDHSPNTIMQFDGLLSLDPNTLYTEIKRPDGGIRSTSRTLPVYFKSSQNIFYKYTEDPPLFIHPYKRPTEKSVRFTPILLTDVHMAPSDDATSTTLTPVERLAILSIITLSVLFMACINFINLSTARASQRSKEVALRKLHGANRGQIIAQFLGEAVAIVICSLILAFVLSELMLPILNQYMAISMVFSYSNIQAIAAITAIILVVGLGSGFYPALVISSYLPIQSLRASPSNSNSGSPKLRKFLIILQFTISTCLIVVTAALYSQIVYSSKMDFGYNPSKLIQVNNVNNVFKNEAAKLEQLRNTSLSSMEVISGNSSSTSITLPKSKKYANIRVNSINEDFLKSFEVDLIAGRGFLPGDVELDGKQRNVIINEAASILFGFQSPQEAIGVIFNSYNKTEATIIGVIPDLVINSVDTSVMPNMYNAEKPKFLTTFTGRYKGDERVVIAELQAIWKSIFPNRPFSYHLAEDRIANEFKEQHQQMIALSIVSALSILIACLGLYGLATFTADQRTKEIGIRKVLGASTRQIIQLLIWQFSKPILLAIAIAFPIAWYISEGMLEKFTYHYDTAWLGVICLCVGLLTLAVAWITVGGQSALVARSKPVNALRDE